MALLTEFERLDFDAFLDQISEFDDWPTGFADDQDEVAAFELEDE